MRSQILQLRQALDDQKVSARQLVEQLQARARAFAFTNFLLATNPHINDEAKAFDVNKATAPHLLAGIPYMLKDNVSTKDIVTTGGSLFLKNYVPPFDATLYRKLQQTNALLYGKTNMDEFGLGGTGTFSAYGHVLHPVDQERSAGGSSSGSAVAVATGAVAFAIGTDTGDSIRRPASLCGVVGYKPTYGRISRFGVYPYAPSLDTVGTFTTSVCDAAIVVDAISGFDENDYSSQQTTPDLYVSLQTAQPKRYRLAYAKNLEPLMTKPFADVWQQLKTALLNADIELVPVAANMDLLHAIDPTYKIISYAEATSCYASFTGIPFGTHCPGKSYEAVAAAARDSLFGAQLKRRFTIGSFALKRENYEKYYLKSQAVRTRLNDHLTTLLTGVDGLITLGASSFAARVDDIVANKAPTNLIDDFLQLANFSGAPSITLPFAKNAQGLSLGLNLMAKPFADAQLLQIALKCEQLLDAWGSFSV